jgi:predicted DNA binding CopG/RHH family protein
MANLIDISAKLEAARPRLQIAEDEIYEINDDKNAILKMQQAFEKSDTTDFDAMIKILDSLLGKENVKKMEANHPGITTRFSQITVLMIAISAAIQGMPYEVAEARFLKTEESE